MSQNQATQFANIGAIAKKARGRPRNGTASRTVSTVTGTMPSTKTAIKNAPIPVPRQLATQPPLLPSYQFRGGVANQRRLAASMATARGWSSWFSR